MMSPEQIVEAGLAAAAGRTDGCIVIVRSFSQANVRWANNTVTTNGLAETVEFSVVAVVGESAATMAGSSTDAESAESVAAVAGAASDAARAAAAGGPARDAMALYASDGADDDFADGAAATSFDVFAGLLPGLATSFAEARAADRLLYGFARHELATVHLGTSTGIRRRWVQPTGTFELNAKSTDMTRSSWTGAATDDFTDVDVVSAHAALAERLGWARRRVDLPPGHYDTVLPPTSVADLMIYLAWSAGARAAHEGRSAFAAAGGTRVGERLTTRPLALYGDPAEVGLACAPFVATAHSSDETTVFDNGAPVRRIGFVEEGVIHDLIHTRASAARYGERFTPAVDNLILTGGDTARTTADLVRGVKRGLLITSLWYIREVDPMTLLLTGLTRDGVFLIENGEVTAAVNNFRFNMSPLDVLRGGVDVGGTERCLPREWSDWFTRTAMPPITVSGFHMSSVSQAQ
jgi:predicted Zn-dependent protease